jgi:hypothetical protein
MFKNLQLKIVNSIRISTYRLRLRRLRPSAQTEPSAAEDVPERPENQFKIAEIGKYTNFFHHPLQKETGRGGGPRMSSCRIGQAEAS